MSMAPGWDQGSFFSLSDCFWDRISLSFWFGLGLWLAFLFLMFGLSSLTRLNT